MSSSEEGDSSSDIDYDDRRLPGSMGAMDLEDYEDDDEDVFFFNDELLLGVTLDDGGGEEGSVGHYVKEYDRYVTRRVGELLDNLEEELYGEAEGEHKLNCHEELEEWRSAFPYLRVRGRRMLIHHIDLESTDIPSDAGGHSIVVEEEEIFAKDGNVNESDLPNFRPWISIDAIDNEDDDDDKDNSLNNITVPLGNIDQPVPEISLSASDNNSSGSSSSSSSSSPKPQPQPQPRKKVVLAPGHSPLDWAKLCASSADLRGTGGRTFARIPVSEVHQHNTKDDAWTVIRGNVYNVTRYLSFHPGGEHQLMRAAGKDGTELFNEKHTWVSVESMLEKCFLGRCDFSC